MDPVGSSNHAAKIECLLFDMDDTLYPMSLGLNMACRKNIEEYMLQYLKIEESEVPKMCLDLYREYGTTMAGLKALGYEFDNDEFHAYVHGRLPYDTLKPDPVLRNLLLSMPQRKIIFTNADKNHAVQVLYRLGLEDCFEGIICFETLNTPLVLPADSTTNYDDVKEDRSLDSTNFYLDEPDEFGVFTETETATKDSIASTDNANNNSSVPKSKILCKPSLKAIQAAIRIAEIDPKKTIFFDDSVRNIASGKTAGLHTVIVGSSVLVPGADLALSSIHNMKEALPAEIWEGEVEEESPDQVLQSTETVVVLA